MAAADALLVAPVAACAGYTGWMLNINSQAPPLFKAALYVMQSTFTSAQFSMPVSKLALL